MARSLDKRQEALELVFACSACGCLLSELQAATKPTDLAQLLSRAGPSALTQLWLSDCGHILCRNELPPSWPLNAIDGGKPLELICPICEAENDGKQCVRSKLFYIRSFEKDGYHPDIPSDLFTMPQGPVGSLFNGIDGTLKFQFASLLKYATNTTREAQAMHRFLEKQKERLSILDEQLTVAKNNAGSVPLVDPAQKEKDEASEAQVKKLLRCVDGTRQLVECLRVTRALLSATTGFSPHEHVAEIDEALRPFAGFFNEPTPTPAQRYVQASTQPAASNLPEIEVTHGRAIPSRQSTHSRQPTWPTTHATQPQPSFQRPQSSILPIPKTISPRQFSIPTSRSPNNILAKRQRVSLAPPKSSSSNSPNRFLSPANPSMPRIRTSHSVRPAQNHGTTNLNPTINMNAAANTSVTEQEMANRFYAASGNTQTLPTPVTNRNVMGPPPTPARQGVAWIRAHEHVPGPVDLPGTSTMGSRGNGGFVSASSLANDGLNAKGGYARTSDGRFARLREK